MSIELEVAENELRNEIEGLVVKIRKAFELYDSDDDNANVLIKNAGELSHRLHMLLENRGIEPKHHSYMVENRGMKSNDPDFYMHIHPIEDLLKFLDDEHANDDPVDTTIGADFKLRIYASRWGGEDTYSVRRTENGWTVKSLAIGGPCDKGGRPFLFEKLRHDSIQYPARLDGWMEWLWEKAATDGLTYEQVQDALQQLGEWISNTEKNAPNGDIWDGF